MDVLADPLAKPQNAVTAPDSPNAIKYDVVVTSGIPKLPDVPGLSAQAPDRASDPPSDTLDALTRRRRSPERSPDADAVATRYVGPAPDRISDLPPEPRRPSYPDRISDLPGAPAQNRSSDPGRIRPSDPGRSRSSDPASGVGLVKKKGFIVALDRDRNIVRVKVWGFWTVDDAKAYWEEFKAKVAMTGGRPWYVLADIADFSAQKPEVNVYVEKTMSYARANGMVRAANLVSSALSKMQIARLSQETGLPSFSFFQSESDAIRWLITAA
jgi:serine/threonine-protein kinase